MEFFLFHPNHFELSSKLEEIKRKSEWGFFIKKRGPNSTTLLQKDSSFWHFLVSIDGLRGGPAIEPDPTELTTPTWWAHTKVRMLNA
ncbi:hypothetical protein SLE2022_183400 [Rubroshorea leprosula]